MHFIALQNGGIISLEYVVSKRFGEDIRYAFYLYKAVHELKELFIMFLSEEGPFHAYIAAVGLKATGLILKHGNTRVVVVFRYDDLVLWEAYFDQYISCPQDNRSNLIDSDDPCFRGGSHDCLNATAFEADQGVIYRKER